MSLLNQVLQDLENRNTRIEPTNYNHQIKAVLAPSKKSNLLPGLLIALLLLFIFFSFYKDQQQAPHSTEYLASSTQVAKDTILAEKKATTISLEIPNNSQLLKTAVKKLLPPLLQKPKQVKQLPLAPNVTKTKANAKKATLTVETPKPIQLNKPIVKTLSSEQQAEQFFQLAKNQSDQADKEYNLLLALNQNLSHIKARLLLAELWIFQGQTEQKEQTEKLLDQGLFLHPQNLPFTNLRSQLYLQKQQTQSALKALLQLDSNNINDETYLSLLGAVFQKENDSFNALKIYQRLVKINTNKAEYWLGYAIALEKETNKQQALTAFQQALIKNPLKPAIVNYIKQRISFLKSHT